MDYEAMLSRARENLPESSKNRERFEIPKVLGHVQGNKTILSNFNQICQLLSRDRNVVWKYILRELASPGVLQDSTATFGRKVSSAMINDKIQKFAQNFVICQDCGKPETEIIKEGAARFLRCNACGSKNPVKGWPG
jgi:translation initiation factor 2 subunit 2